MVIIVALAIGPSFFGLHMSEVENFLRGVRGKEVGYKKFLHDTGCYGIEVYAGGKVVIS